MTANQSDSPPSSRDMDETERFRVLLDHSNEAVLLVNVDSGEIVDCNATACRMLDMDRAVILGKSLVHFMPPPEAEYLAERLEKTDWSRLLDSVVTQLQPKAGPPLSVEMSIRFVRLGETAYGVVVARDVSDRLKAEEELASLNRQLERLVSDRTRDLERRTRELEEANEQLRELDKMKSAFLSSVSHELRTPLTSVRGFANLVTRDFIKLFWPLVENDPALRKRAERIVDNLRIVEDEGERLTSLVDDVLDLNKIESGRMPWNDVVVHPADVLEQALHVVRGLFEDKPQVRLSMDVPDSLPPIKVDPDRLAQVFINLLDNAAKFTAQGEVALRARPQENGGVRFDVTDTGEGILPEDMDRIFDKFYQVRRGDPHQAKPRGTGLGLCICRQIVEHYQGDIRVESELDGGSTFTVIIPPMPLPGG